MAEETTYSFKYNTNSFAGFCSDIQSNLRTLDDLRTPVPVAEPEVDKAIGTVPDGDDVDTPEVASAAEPESSILDRIKEMEAQIAQLKLGETHDNGHSTES